jgi:hypothetical protein
MERPCLIVRRSAAGTQGLLGYDRPELHVQSGIVVTDPEARACAISEPCGSSNQRGRSDSTGPGNRVYQTLDEEPLDVLYEEEDCSVESVMS